MGNLLVLLCLLFSPALVAGENYSPSFLNYIKKVENGVGKGFKDGRWYPHVSVEGGAKTIAYGHKIQPFEDFSEGLTEEEALDLLVRDLRRSEALAADWIEGKYGQVWSDLNKDQREILIDFQFNGVLRSFPKFTKAVLDWDLDGMRKEYKRYAKLPSGKRIELKDRNQRFAQRYLTPQITEQQPLGLVSRGTASQPLGAKGNKRMTRFF